jgi:electron transport complex protein RnfB
MMLRPSSPSPLLASVFGLLLGYSAIRFRVEGDPIADQIDACCRRPSAASAASPAAGPMPRPSRRARPRSTAAPRAARRHDRAGRPAGRDPVPLDDEEAAEKPKSVAYIVEAECIGCTLCIQACPVDAIMGAAKQMHTVIADECTGCELCLPPARSNASTWSPLEDHGGHLALALP